MYDAYKWDTVEKANEQAFQWHQYQLLWYGNNRDLMNQMLQFSKLILTSLFNELWLIIWALSMVQPYLFKDVAFSSFII